MDWLDYEFSPLDASLLNELLSSPDLDQQLPMEKSTEWTFEENKLFENLVMELDFSSPDFFQNVASRIPGKSVDGIKNRFEALVHDLELMESGQVPPPNYEVHAENPKILDNESTNQKDEGSSSSQQAKTMKLNVNGQVRKRGVPWTEAEHQLFLMGLNKYGRGDWRSISRFFVVTKSPTQVASHAQKYYRRQASSTPADRRRPSIHDIQTVDLSSFIPMPPNVSNVYANNDVAPMAPYSSYGYSSTYNNPMMSNSNYNGGNYYMETNPNPNPTLTMNYNGTAYPAAVDPFYDQIHGGAYPSSSSSYYDPFLGNQKWA